MRWKFSSFVVMRASIEEKDEHKTEEYSTGSRPALKCRCHISTKQFMFDYLKLVFLVQRSSSQLKKYRATVDVPSHVSQN